MQRLPRCWHARIAAILKGRINAAGWQLWAMEAFKVYFSNFPGQTNYLVIQELY